ncbi:unnamed protein product [Closterium sp. Naga37s-1]|nr:unnamed protein product [Closterium sp. Naga37s-1]
MLRSAVSARHGLFPPTQTDALAAARHCRLQHHLMPCHAMPCSLWMQSVSTRNAGYSIVNISYLTAATNFLFCGFMYVAVYPVLLTRQSSRAQRDLQDSDDLAGFAEDLHGGVLDSPYMAVYPVFLTRQSSREQRDVQDSDDLAVFSEDLHGGVLDSSVLAQGRHLVAQDSVYLFVSVFLICVIQNGEFNSDPANWTVFKVIFEIIRYAPPCPGLASIDSTEMRPDGTRPVLVFSLLAAQGQHLVAVRGTWWHSAAHGGSPWHMVAQDSVSCGNAGMSLGDSYLSAYGNVGLSLGNSCPTSNPDCTDAPPYSFSGSWSVLSKLIVILVMLLGRHRGLPVLLLTLLPFLLPSFPTFQFYPAGTWSVMSKLIVILVMLLGRHRGLPDNIDAAIVIPPPKQFQRRPAQRITGDAS